MAPESSSGESSSEWRYLTVYLSGELDFPDSVNRAELLKWAGKALSQQMNDYARQGWEVLSLRWVSDVELMVVFQRPALAADHPDNARRAGNITDS